MANLETLELQINGSATGATGGITTLIGSLSDLGTVVSEQLGKLRELKSVLDGIKTATGGSARRSIANAVGSSDLQKQMATNKKSIESVNTAMKEQIKNITGINNATQAAKQTWADTHRIKPDQRMPIEKDPSPFMHQVGTQGMKEYLESRREYHVQALNNRAMKQAIWDADHAKQTTVATKSIKELTAETKNYSKSTKDATESTKAYNSEATKTSQTIQPVKKTASAVHNLMTTVGRMAKTMLIRQALKALISGAKEGLNNFYQYSKRIGSEYSKTLDSLAVSTGMVKNQFGAALGTALSAVIPILNAIASAALFALNALTALFALLGGSSSWSKATKGADTFGKAVGGGGSAMKELLADFDELNLIASEGGGGGGGGGNLNFGSMFEETPFPRWLEEWRPLINAILAGTLGGILLPKIFDWLSKIFGLGNTPGANMIKNILDKLFGTGNKTTFPNWPYDGKKFPSSPNYVFPDWPYDNKTFPSSPNYIFPPWPYNNLKFDVTGADDAVKIAGAVATISTMGPGAAKGIEAITTAVSKLKGVLTGIDLFGTLLKKLLEGVLGGNTKIKVDRSEYDDFKKDFEDFFKQNNTKTIHIAFVTAEYMTWSVLAAAVDEWVKKKDIKTVNIAFSVSDYMQWVVNVAAINKWLEKKDYKTIGIAFNMAEYLTWSTFAKAVDEWINKKHDKTIGIAFNMAQYLVWATYVDTVNKWVEKAHNKTIGIAFNAAQYLVFVAGMAVVDTWVSKESKKDVKIGFDASYIAWTVLCGVVDAWVGKEAKKTVKIGFDGTNYETFIKNCGSVDTWVNKESNKTVGIAFSILEYMAWLASSAVVDTWVNKESTKTVGIGFDLLAYAAFFVASAAVDTWVNASATKSVKVEFNLLSWTGFWTCVGALLEFVTAIPTKKVKVAFDDTSLTNFNSIATAIDEWASTSITKKIYVETVQTGGGGNGNGGSSSGKNSSNNEGLDWSLNKGLTYNGNNVGQSIIDGIVDVGTSVWNWATGLFKAEGAYGIPSGDLFIANEAGAELVGSINGRTSVANQGQIIEGIQKGVRDANADQNTLLRQQNELLRQILEKDNSVRIGASAALGKVASQSLSMYNRAAGVGGV